MIKNLRNLLENSRNPKDKRARKLALEATIAAVEAVDPRKIIRRNLRVENDYLVVGGRYPKKFELSENIYVVGCGKASGMMAEELEKILGSRIKLGFVNILRGTKEKIDTKRIELNEAGHPIPDEDSLKGAKKILEVCRLSSRNIKNLLIILISGGGSALMSLPVDDLSFQEKLRIHNLLYTSGANIIEITQCASIFLA